MNISLIASEFFINVARGIFALALGMYLYSISGSILGFAVTYISELVISALLRKYSGDLVDNQGARKVLITSCLFCAVLFIPTLWLDDLESYNSNLQHYTVMIAVLLTIALNCARPFITAGVYSAVVIHTSDRLHKQNSWLSIALQSGQVIGISLAGIILELSSINWVCFTVLICYLLAAASYWLFWAPPKNANEIAKEKESGKQRANKQKLLVYIKQNPKVLVFNLLSAIDFALVGLFALLLAPVVASHFDNLPRWLAILDLSFTAGSMFCAVLIAMVLFKDKLTWLVSMMSIITGALAFFAMFNAKDLYLYLAMISFGFCVNYSYIYWTTQSQKVVDDEFSGSIGALKHLLNSGMMALVASFITVVQAYEPAKLMHAAIGVCLFMLLVSLVIFNVTKQRSKLAEKIAR